MEKDDGFNKRVAHYAEAITKMVDESEKLFERKIEEYLTSPEGGWQKATDAGYKNEKYKGMALDIVTLTDFVKASQPMAWKRFERMCNIDPVRQFYKAFDSAVNQVGLIEVLRHGFKHRGVQFSVCYFAPESTMNKLAVENYQKNVCQCIRQWHYSETNTNTVDMMLALNGIPIVAIELKNQMTGQSIDDAKRQWMYNRTSAFWHILLWIFIMRRCLRSSIGIRLHSCRLIREAMELEEMAVQGILRLMMATM